MNEKKIIIFDFDGTIADTREILFKIINQLAPKYKFYEIQNDEIKYFKNMTFNEIVDFLNINLIYLPFMLFDIRKVFHKFMDKEISIKHNLSEVILKLKEKNDCIIGILTSNSAKNVEKFLKQKKFMIFDFIHSTFFVNKQRYLKKIKQKYSVKPDKILYIGDEPRDIISARAARIKIAAVTWGYSSKSLLQEYDPDYIIDKPEEILSIVSKL